MVARPNSKPLADASQVLRAAARAASSQRQADKLLVNLFRVRLLGKLPVNVQSASLVRDLEVPLPREVLTLHEILNGRKSSRQLEKSPVVRRVPDCPFTM